mmetsp:Transcript_4709/g.6902  ORF Transcript_4709/g.6902 Transcript_4709/m.6902 type:complete len:337 (+) Transcript_4709:97-1107(+)
MRLCSQHAVYFLVVSCFVLLLQFDSNFKEPERRLETSKTGVTGTSHGEAVWLLTDGTLLVGRQTHPVTCQYVTSVFGKPQFLLDKNITRIHYSFQDCNENQLGNRLGEHFGHQLLANFLGIPYTMTCGEEGSGSNQILLRNNQGPVTGESVLKSLEVTDRIGPAPTTNWTVNDYCMNCYGLSWFCKQGPELLDAREQLWNITIMSIEPEDAVIHLRLGDALQGKHDEGIGLLPFQAYTNRMHEAVGIINKTIKTIGIVTQPFDKNVCRRGDCRLISRSQTITMEFITHLRDHFPQAKVNIHNEPSETPKLSFTRLMRARVTAICGSTTFCTVSFGS